MFNIIHKFLLLRKFSIVYIEKNNYINYIFAPKLRTEQKADFIVTSKGQMVQINVKCVKISVGLPFNTSLRMFLSILSNIRTHVSLQLAVNVATQKNYPTQYTNYTILLISNYFNIIVQKIYYFKNLWARQNNTKMNDDIVDRF